LQGKHKAIKPYRNTPFIPPFPETNTKIQNQLIYSNLKEYRCKPQNSSVWLVQGAAIYINIAAPCTTEIHTENQHFTLRVKPRVQPRFLHRLLLLCFSCNPVIPKNKKSPKHFPFSVKISIFASVPRAERSNAAKPAQLPNRYRLPNFLLFKSYLPTDYKKTIVFPKENGGVSSARNLGLENVRGNILTFIDADDWIDVDCFENGVCIMDRDDLDILQYSYKMIREQDGCVISVRNYECVPLGWREFVRTDHYIVCVGGNFIRSSIVKTYRLRFDEALHLAEDQLFIMRVMSLSTRIAQTKEIYYNYFQNLASATHNSCEEDMVKSSRALLEFGKRNRLFKPQVDRMITNFYVELLLLNNGQAGILDSVYREAKVEIRNLNMNSLRILCFSSFLGMRMAGKIVLAYLKIKKFCMLS
jgi:glycosyltransferase involved in cell wall biosynthesis